LKSPIRLSKESLKTLPKDIQSPLKVKIVQGVFRTLRLTSNLSNLDRAYTSHIRSI
jgi:hypothetical protein